MKQFYNMHPILRMPAEQESAGGGDGHQYFSLADAGQYEDEIIEGYRGDLDANASLPPLPHDVYLTRVRYLANWPDTGDVLAENPNARWRKQYAKDGNLMYLSWIEIATEGNKDESVNGRVRQEVITTYATKRGTTAVQAMLQGMDIDTIALNGHQAQVQAVDKAIGGDGALAGQELDWEATVFEKEAVQKDKQGNPILAADGSQKKGVEYWRLRGMKKFPQDKEGGYIPEICEADGHTYTVDGVTAPVTEARARNFSRRWVPASKLMGPTQLETQLQQSVEQAQAQKVPAAVAQAAAAPVAQQAQQAAAPAPTAARSGPVRPGGPVRRVATAAK